MAELAETHWVCFHGTVLQSLMVWIWLFPFGLCTWTVLVRMSDSFWFTRLHSFMSLKEQEIRDPYKWSEQPWHSWSPTRWLKKLVPINGFTKSNIFTFGNSCPWPLPENGHGRNLKDMEKWNRLGKESVFYLAQTVSYIDRESYFWFFFSCQSLTIKWKYWTPEGSFYLGGLWDVTPYSFHTTRQKEEWGINLLDVLEELGSSQPNPKRNVTKSEDIW